MAEVNLTQAEADALLAMEKRSEGDEPYRFPGKGSTLDDFMRYCNITQAPNILRLPIV